jgi:hypothetical protein
MPKCLIFGAQGRVRTGTGVATPRILSPELFKNVLSTSVENHLSKCSVGNGFTSAKKCAFNRLSAGCRHASDTLTRDRIGQFRGVA